jgi:hypothetical protein
MNLRYILLPLLGACLARTAASDLLVAMYGSGAVFASEFSESRV